jgi:hypothetical protein
MPMGLKCQGRGRRQGHTNDALEITAIAGHAQHTEEGVEQ